MDRLKFEIVTAERIVHSDEVDVVVAPGQLGQMAILPHHAALITTLEPGELLVRKGRDEQSIFVSGGFLEVRGDRVVVLADTAERAEDIDISRAEEAKRRAQERMTMPPDQVDHARTQAALMRSLLRLRVAEKSKRRRASPR